MRRERSPPPICRNTSSLKGGRSTMGWPSFRRYCTVCTRPGLTVHKWTPVLLVLLSGAAVRDTISAPAAPPGGHIPIAADSPVRTQRVNVARPSALSLGQPAAQAGQSQGTGTAGHAAFFPATTQNTTAVSEYKREGAEEGAARPRRLAFSRALISTIAQYFFHSDVRRVLKRAGYRLAEVVKGIPTADYDLNYYQKKENCLTSFDIVNEWGILGPVAADSIEIKYLPAQHRGVLIYSENRRSSVEFLKPIQRHVQNFLVPHGCVGTTNSTWVAYCTTVDPPCIVGRIDIFTSPVPADEPLVPLQPIDHETFSGKLLEDGWEWYEVQDLYEAVPDYPKPLYMTWAYEHCMLHAYFETKALEKTQYFWMKSRQAFQIMMEQVDGTPYRKMSAFPPSCGGREAKDFVVTWKALEPAGQYKAIMSAKIYGDSVISDPEEIVLKQQEPLRPLEDWDTEEGEVDFVELFPEAHAAPLYELESGPFE